MAITISDETSSLLWKNCVKVYFQVFCRFYRNPIRIREQKSEMLLSLSVSESDIARCESHLI